MANLPMALEEEINTRWPVTIWGDTRLLVAVSGGIDSVALLCALLRMSQRAVSTPQSPKKSSRSTKTSPTLKTTAVATSTDVSIDVAHFNHGWRGESSDQDEAFVTQLCQRWGVRLFVGRDGAAAAGHAIKTEEHARHTRYAFLTETAYACGARYVVTGHTANDRVETVLHNLFRGSGLAGVTSPSLTRQLDRDLVLVRPLIASWREEIVDYLSELGETFREDASNSDTQYRRNYLRHSLLPLLRQEYGPHVDERLWSFSELAEEAIVALRESAAEYLRLVEALRRDAGLVGDRESAWLPTLNQLTFPWVVVREALRELWLARHWKLQGMSREHWDAVRELMNGDTSGGKKTHLNLPGGLIARCEGEWLRIHCETD